MKTLALVLVLLLVGVGYKFYRQQTTIREQQKQIADLLAREAAQPRSAPLEYQGKCADQANKFFRDGGFKLDEMAGYENHFNTKLNKCFVLIQNTDARNPQIIWTHKSLYDAFEGKAYGQYAWHTMKDKKYWEVPPVMCKVWLPGEERICKSDDEFDELIKAYMVDQ
jgi:hypothetical protein